MTMTITKGDELDYRFEWRSASNPWLADGENLVSATVSVIGPIEVVSSTIDGDDVVVWVRPLATAGAIQAAKLRCRVTTDNATPRKKTAEMEFQVNA